ncbi:hypothetical protein [Paenibacillus lactis]|uniref:hypothetical protein n=1 Tax=Paenibacillus lactis TaxID=228574 RepID=UPI003D730975
MNAIYELEKAKIDFYMIFNEKSDNYNFANTEHIKLVNRYGLYCEDVAQAIELANLHTKIQLDSATCGVVLDDSVLFSLIGNGFSTSNGKR